MSKAHHINYAIFEDGTTSVLLNGEHYGTYATPSEAMINLYHAINTLVPGAELFWHFDGIMDKANFEDDSDSAPQKVEYLTLVSDSEE